MIRKVCRAVQPWLPLLPSAALGLAVVGLVLGMLLTRAPRNTVAADPATKAARSGGLGQRPCRRRDSVLHGERRVLVLPSQRGRRNLANQQAQPHDSRARGRRSGHGRAPGQCGRQTAGRRRAALVGRQSGTTFREALAQAYGKPDMLSPVAAFGRGRRARLEKAEQPHWDAERLPSDCAGCHATAVDPNTHAFAAVSIDCYACHGDAPAEHANDPKLMPLAKARKDSPAVVTSICASCHVRYGKSKGKRTALREQLRGRRQPVQGLPGRLRRGRRSEQLNPGRSARARERARRGGARPNGYDLPHLPRRTCRLEQEAHRAGHREDLPALPRRRQPIKGHKPYEVHSERCQY